MEPFEEIFSDPTIDEVLVDGWGSMSVVRGEYHEARKSPFSDRDAFAEWLFTLAAASGTRLDPMRPAAGGSLQDGGFRWHAVLGGVAPAGPLLTLRRHRFGTIGTIGFAGDLPALYQAFDAGKPLVIAGPTGSGKTTLLAALLAERAPAERVVVLESLAELPHASPHWVRLVERAPNLEGRGGIDLRRLLRESLRLRPDRLIIGEVRGVEARVFAEAALTGHRGVATTMHASSRSQVLARLSALAPAGLVDELVADLVVATLRARQIIAVA